MNYRLLIAVTSLFLLSVASVLTITGQASAQTTAATPDSDESIVAAVKSALAAKPELKANDLIITSKNGEVKLAGDVEDGQALYNIGLVAQKVEGVKFVVNEMNPKH